MSKWKQVGGDRDWSGVGCTLARDNRSARSVDLRRITPWLEMDSSAIAEGYGLWDVSEGAVDYEDMSVERESVQSAIRSAGVSVLDYKKMTPSHKAALIAEHGGVFEESRSVNDLAKVLPKPVDQIEFWAGKTSAEEIKTANQQMRREATEKLYTRHRGEVPKLDALEFATGGEPVSVDLDDEETQALRYADACASGKYQWQKPKASDQKVVAETAASLRQILTILAAAPKAENLAPEALAQLHRCYDRDFELDWDDKDEQVRSMIDDDAEAARELAENILGDLGF